MPDPISAISSVVSIGGSLLQADAQSNAASDAAAASQAAADKAAGVSRENFNKAAEISQRNLDEGMRIAQQRYNDGMSLFSPYLSAGGSGMAAFQALGGFYNPANGSVPATYQQYLSDFNAANAPRIAAPAPLPPPPVAPTMPQGISAAPTYDPTKSVKQNNIAYGNWAEQNKNKSSMFAGILNDPRRANSALVKQLQQSGIGIGQRDIAAFREYEKQKQEYDQKLAEYNAQKQAYDQQMAQYEAQAPARVAMTQQQYNDQFGQPALTQEQFAQRQQEEANRAQQLSIDQITKSPLYSELFKQGEDALLQNASATGGMRGGNTQGALAYYRPSVLKQLIEDKMKNAQFMAGLGAQTAGQAAGIGQNYTSLQGQLLSNQAANMGNMLAGQSTQMADILTNNATNQGNAALIQGNTQGQMFGGIAQGLGGLASGLGGLFNGGGGIGISSAQRAPQQYAAGSTLGGFGLRGLN